MKQKIPISQDALYEYMKDHGVKIVRLAELSRLSKTTFNLCFKHVPHSNGTPRSFSANAVEAINQALPQIAAGLRSCILAFGSEQTFVNQLGMCYDPALVEPIKKVGYWMNLTVMTRKVLGWSYDKKEARLTSPSSYSYGNITKKDVNRINAELLSVAGMLDGVEVKKSDML
ncbi:MAG: hypothetical protein PUC18_12540 [Prevotellaceae bacterium]|nr:hypothetical protein [Prevotellaceae bacterium]